MLQSQVFLLFRVHGDRWLFPLSRVDDLMIDELELGVSILVVLAFESLAIGLEAIVETAQQGRNRLVTHLVSLILQRQCDSNSRRVFGSRSSFILQPVF